MQSVNSKKRKLDDILDFIENKRPSMDEKYGDPSKTNRLEPVAIATATTAATAVSYAGKPFQACIIGTSMVKHVSPKSLFENEKCFFKSISGGLIKNVLEFVRARVDFFHECKCFIVTCGSNDCDSTRPIKDTIETFVELAVYLSQTYPNARFLFNKLIPRTKTRYVSLEEFEKSRTCFNHFLESTLTLLVPACKIVNHESFELKENLELLLADGVHMSPLRGVPAYVNDIKQALQEGI
jgi:hypothetical protein